MFGEISEITDAFCFMIFITGGNSPNTSKDKRDNDDDDDDDIGYHS